MGIYSLTCIGLIILFWGHWLLAPAIVKQKMRKVELHQPTSFYRKNLKKYFRERRNEQRRGVEEFIDMDEENVLAVFVVFPLLIGIIWGLLAPLSLFLTLCLLWRSESFIVSCRLIYGSKLPAYVVFDGDEMGFMAYGKILKRKNLFALLKEPMIRPESARELVRLKPIAKEVMELEEALERATKTLSQTDLEAGGRAEVEVRWDDLSKLLKAHKLELREAEDVWLHLTGKQLHAGFYQLAEKKRPDSNEPDSNNTVSQEISFFENPALSDMKRIANDPSVDENTRQMALKTAFEIEQKLIEEKHCNKENEIHSSAMASIITARRMFELDETTN